MVPVLSLSQLSARSGSGNRVFTFVFVRPLNSIPIIAVEVVSCAITGLRVFASPARALFRVPPSMPISTWNWSGFTFFILYSEFCFSEGEMKYIGKNRMIISKIAFRKARILSFIF